jgi:peptidoglycan-N-acetylglucosamine deacetylase
MLLVAVCTAVAASVPAFAQQGLPGFEDPEPSQAPPPSSEPSEAPAPRTPRPPQVATREPAATPGTTVVSHDDTSSEGSGHTHSTSVPSASRASSMLANVSEAGKMIALTLDDGWNADPAILEMTETWGIRGTAFLTGGAAGSEPELVERLKEGGWEICSHTYSHAILTNLSESRIAGELERGQEAVEEASGQECPYVRPPYGKVDSRVEAAARYRGLRLVGWETSLSDATSPDTDPALQTKIALQYMRPGSILLGHFGGVHSFIVLRDVLTAVLGAGYRVGSVSDLLAAGGEVPPHLEGTASEDTELTTLSASNTKPAPLRAVRARPYNSRGPTILLVGGIFGLAGLTSGSLRSRRRRYHGLRRVARQLSREAAKLPRESVNVRADAAP